MRLSDPNVSILVGFILLLVVAGFTSYYAEVKGRNPVVWFVIALLFGILAPLALFFLPSIKSEEPAISVFSPSEHQPQSPPVRPPVLKPKSRAEDKLWYYLDANHEQYGPLSVIGLQQLWNTGKLELTSYVWSEGMKDWELVANLSDLKEALEKTQI